MFLRAERRRESAVGEQFAANATYNMCTLRKFLKECRATLLQSKLTTCDMSRSFDIQNRVIFKILTISLDGLHY